MMGKKYTRPPAVHGRDHKPRAILPAMNAKTPAQIAEKPLKLRAKLSRALDIIAIEGQTQREAARRAGMHEDSLSRALARPEVAAELEKRMADCATSIDQLRGMAKASAVRVGMDLMHNAKDEKVKARMVEFFAGEARGPAVAVQVNMPASGYVYRPPADARSGVDVVQYVDTEGKSVKPAP